MTSEAQPTAVDTIATGSAESGPDGRLLPIPFGERIPVDGTPISIRYEEPRALSDAEVETTLEVLRAAFNGGPGWYALPVPERDHFEWKYRDAPYRSVVTIIEDGDRLIGFNGQLQRHWLAGGVRSIGCDYVESATLPEYQGRGLYGRRLDVAKRYGTVGEFDLVFGSHPATQHDSKKRGDGWLGATLDNLVRPLDVGKYVRRARPDRPTTSQTRIAIERGRRRLPRPLIARRLAWRLRMLRQRLAYRALRFPRGSWSVRTVAEFDERITAFFEAAASAFDLIQVRDREFLNWRYADRRAGPFTIRIAEDGDTILGYVVVRALATGADLADLLVLPGRDDVAYALVRDALDVARAAGAPAMRSWMVERHPYHRLLLHHGFIPVRRIVEPTYESRTTPVQSFLTDPDAAVHLMLGDTDHL